MKRKILVYTGKGVFQSSAQGWVKAFRDRGYHVIECDQRMLVRYTKRADIAAVIMPGGNSGDPALEDETIKASLGDTGMKAVEDYAHRGMLVAVCGSAYRLSNNITFYQQKDGEHVTLNEKGSGLIDMHTSNWLYYDDSPKTAAIASVSFNEKALNVFYHGGPVFEFDSSEEVKPFLYFEGGEIAGAEIKKGQGRIILLSVHPEYVDVKPQYPSSTKASNIVRTGHSFESLANAIKSVEADHIELLDHVVGQVKQFHAKKQKSGVAITSNIA